MLLAARRLFLTYLALLCCSGCATLDKNHESPKIDVVGITKAASDTSAMQFTIQLRIVNPNAETIDLHGLYYELSLEGIEVVTGTAKDLPPIEGYSARIVSVSSAASLLSTWLTEMPNLHIVTTSREPLGWPCDPRSLESLALPKASCGNSTAAAMAS